MGFSAASRGIADSRSGAVVLRASVNRLSGWCSVLVLLGFDLIEDEDQRLPRPLGGAGRRPTSARAVMSDK